MIAALLKPVVKRPFFLALLASLVSLGTAYVAQYGFGLHPCELCMLQRVPYAIVIVVAGIALFLSRRSVWLLLLIALLFLADSGIATYHALVEKHVIAGPSACTVADSPAGQSLEDFIHKIEITPIVACDQPPWDFHGITMAGFNAAWALLLSIAFFIAAQHYYRKEVRHA